MPQSVQKTARPDPERGLSQSEVLQRIANGEQNLPVDPPSKSIAEIIKSNVFTYFNLVFAIIAALLVIAGSFRNLTFLPVIVFNTLIGILQEIRAKRVLDKLNMLNAPQVQVMRDGKLQKIPTDQAVLSDIAVFHAGNQICADAQVVSGEVQVNEALLTGESDEITKREGDTLMSGSFIVAGECRACLTHVGADSYISRLMLKAKAARGGEQSEMIRSLDKLVKWVGIIIFPLGLILFLQQFVLHSATFRQSIEGTVAAIIGMIPEGLYLLASVAMVISAMRLAKRRVLLHDMKCIETLARVNVLCVDKTGTITENTMKVQRLVEASGFSAAAMPPLRQQISDFVACMTNDNQTMAAMREYFTEATGKRACAFTPFSSSVKYCSVTFDDAAFVLGAPEFVLRADFAKYRGEIGAFEREGYRVLVYGQHHGAVDGRALRHKVTPLAYVLIANPVRADAKKTFAYFEEQGVAIKVISGDSPVTVARVAQEAGIAHSDRVIDASRLRTEAELAQAAEKYTVFGRVTPAQKQTLIRALKAAGNTVAMTGDGVNDVLALKDADCSVAMASGSEAAAQASQLVLLDSNFSCMTSVIAEGRRVVNNIERSASLFLVKNIFSFLLALVSLFFGFSYPLDPSQISLISVFTIGAPGFFLALEPNKSLISGHFLTNVLLRALPAGLTDVLAVGALVIMGRAFGLPSADVATAATMLLSIVGFMIVYRISQPMNTLRWFVWGGCMLGLLSCSIWLGDLFAITAMSSQCVMLFVVFAIATEPVLRYLSLAVQFAQQHWHVVSDKFRRKAK